MANTNSELIRLDLPALKAQPWSAPLEKKVVRATFYGATTTVWLSTVNVDVKETGLQIEPFATSNQKVELSRPMTAPFTDRWYFYSETGGQVFIIIEYIND